MTIFVIFLYRSESTTGSSPSALTNTFSNDGSFLEQFKKMQDGKERQKDMLQKPDERGTNFLLNKTKADSQKSIYSSSAENKSHKDILSSPPPPPPSRTDIQQHDRKGIKRVMLK